MYEFFDLDLRIAIASVLLTTFKCSIFLNLTELWVIFY